MALVGVRKGLVLSEGNPGFSSVAALPGLQTWLEANDTTTLWQDTGATVPVALDGDPVARWDSKTGASVNVQQGTAANQPTFQSAEYNGRHAIRFAGTDDFITGSTVARSSPLTVVAVALMSSNVATGTLFDGVSATIRYSMRHTAGSSVIIIDSNNTNSTTAASFLASLAIYTLIGTSSSAILRVNGLAYPSVAAPSAGFAGIKLGTSNPQNSFWVGDLAELIICGKLSSNQIRGLERYLADLYAITLS